ncbi:hypothetical protein CEXT_809501 [Caerostris extrusa]|uniref:Uncharacterized protein n=1 Tax=Caerostris extrusa TaxID=172846 RepID=A0AAV4T6A7_CAEEX|nr:hypothetical protein CEXT_809501 [Caerostris extrusa]
MVLLPSQKLASKNGIRVQFSIIFSCTEADKLIRKLTLLDDELFQHPVPTHGSMVDNKRFGSSMVPLSLIRLIVNIVCLIHLRVSLVRLDDSKGV